MELKFTVAVTPKALREMGNRLLMYADVEENNQDILNPPAFSMNPEPVVPAPIATQAPIAPVAAPPPPPAADAPPTPVAAPITPVAAPPPPPAADAPPMPVAAKFEVETAPDPAPAPTETDSKGLPWDERIHSSSKAVTAKGEWRARRGVDPAIVAQVEAELRGATPAQPPINAPAAPAAPTPDADEYYLPASDTYQEMTFAILAMHVSKLRQLNLIEDSLIDSLCAAQGVASFPLLAGLGPEKLMAVYVQLVEACPS